MKKNKAKKVLLVTQENFFGEVEDCNIDFFSTTEPFTPLPTYHKNSVAGFFKIAVNLLLRRYDLIFLPTPNLIYPWDRSKLKKKLRNIVRVLINSPLFGRLVRFFTAKSKVIIIDRYAISTVQLDYWKMFGPNSDYYTTNLSVANHQLYNESSNKPPVGNAYHLPLYIYTEKYNPPSGVQKDIDLFFSGTINSDAREEALPALQLLKEKGYNVVIYKDRLNMEQFLHYLSRSYLCLSPAGVGYDCFRHYEIMLCSSVPIINLPKEPLMLPLHHGGNCFLYKDADDLVAQVEFLLTQKEMLVKMGKELSQQVHGTNNIYSVGRKMLYRYIDRPVPEKSASRLSVSA
ncbi:MAG TPA: hypothetical protein VLC28_09335 [Flavitalea sp.]|nr:hypothetical protein [Flavitalea sp.]